MKKILFFLLFAHATFGQSVELQTEILTRVTADSCLMINSIREAQKVISENRVDYVMITNGDDVNAFYYQDGSLHILTPGTTDIFLTTRDNTGRVMSYPSFFFDKSSYDKKISFRIGLCRNCRNSTLGIQYGFLDKIR